MWRVTLIASKPDVTTSNHEGLEVPGVGRYGVATDPYELQSN